MAQEDRHLRKALVAPQKGIVWRRRSHALWDRLAVGPGPVRVGLLDCVAEVVEAHAGLEEVSIGIDGITGVDPINHAAFDLLAVVLPNDPACIAGPVRLLEGYVRGTQLAVCCAYLMKVLGSVWLLPGAPGQQEQTGASEGAEAHGSTF